MSTLKTEYGFDNEYNFVEMKGSMRELTVTITLSEYRDLITTNERLSENVYNLKKDVDKLTEQNKNLSQAILVCDGGKLFKDIWKAIGNAFAPNEQETEEETE